MNAPAEFTLRDRIDQLRAAGQPLDLAHAIGLIVPLAVELASQHEQGYNFYLYPSALFLGADDQYHASERSAELPTDPRDQVCIPPESLGVKPGTKRQSVYGIAAILYELITLESVGPNMRRPSDVVPGMPQGVELVLGKALIPDPNHRPDDLNALAQALYQTDTTYAPPPPPADVSHLDHDGDIDIDVSMSLLPPPPKQGAAHGQVIAGMALDAPLPPGVRAPSGPRSAPRSGGADDLLATKARLESDPSPRYVVIKDGMDHGPFAAVELLQQIASHTFEEEDLVRDGLSGTTVSLREHPDFAQFARHARMHRHEKAEKAAIHAAVAQESRSTAGKTMFGLLGVGAILLAGGVWFLTSRGKKDDTIAVVEEKAANIESDQGLKAKKKGGGGGVIGKSGGIPQLAGGGSCEAAQSAYVEEMRMDGKGQADLTAGQFQAVLGNGSYLNACGVPPNVGVNICAAIQNGRAVGVTVRTSPASGSMNSCIASKIRGLSFPSHPKLDVTRTSFAAN